MRFRTLALALCFLFPGSGAMGQMIGLAGLLNPEGSRLFPQPVVAPRHAGKPDPRWKVFNWRYTDREVAAGKYRLFFYEDEEWTARFAVPRIEEQMQALSTEFQFVPPTRFSYLLFTSLQDFRQANIFFVTEGVQGITSTQEATMAIPYWGDRAAFDHVSKHEMVHQFQVQRLRTRANYHPAEDLIVPLWFIEGMAEYYSLNGVDAETRMHLRDLLIYPDKAREYAMPRFFEEGPLDFARVYKAGQAKVDFLEKEFGKGTMQRLLAGPGDRRQQELQTFAEAASPLLKSAPEAVESRWQAHLEREYRSEAAALKQEINDEILVKDVEDTLDAFRISPDGKLMAIRRVDPLSGVASIRLSPLDAPKEYVEVAKDHQLNLLSLYFFQAPSLALSDTSIAYAVSTSEGVELEVRSIEQKASEARPSLELGPARRLQLHRAGWMQLESLAFSPDGRQLALVGLNAKGWTNVYVVPVEKLELSGIRPLTYEFYGWKTVSWRGKQILAVTDRNAEKRFGLATIDPESGRITQLTAPGADQLGPIQLGDRYLFQSWEGGSSQLHELVGRRQRRLTDVKTGLLTPEFAGDSLYALALKSGRYHLVRLKPGQLLKAPVEAESPPPLPADEAAVPWQPKLAQLEESSIFSYRPFLTSGIRVDGLFAYFASGSAGGLAASMSDLMRNYDISAEFSALGSLKYTNTYLLLSSQEGRGQWTTGAYAILQPRLDNTFAQRDETVRTYLHREYGVLGALQYPLAPFSYADLGLRIAGVRRSEFNDPALAGEWDARNPGAEFSLAPVVRLGYDSILYETFSGPLEGFGILAEADTTIIPGRASVSERLRLDVSRYFQLKGRTVLALQGMLGGSWGGDYRNAFLVSSDDILRGYSFLDNRLFGNYLVAGKVELRFPIGSLFGFPPLRGLAAYDLGSVYRQPGELGRQISSSYTGGLALNIPPLAITFMLSKPIRSAPGPDEGSIAHFTLRYLYL